MNSLNKLYEYLNFISCKVQYSGLVADQLKQLSEVVSEDHLVLPASLENKCESEGATALKRS
jgi:hypothetical protein